MPAELAEPSVVEAMAKAICAETCAFKGEPPCYDMDERFPPPACDEPGCLWLAWAALAAVQALREKMGD